MNRRIQYIFPVVFSIWLVTNVGDLAAAVVYTHTHLREPAGVVR